jgi:para-nitrobenzyl esterase
MPEGNDGAVPAFYPALYADAELTTGRVRGMVSQGVRVFRGIPYGQAARFATAQPAAPWAGRRDCFGPGAVAPQVPPPVSNAYARLIQFDRAPADGGLSEQCLTLNVFAPPVPAQARPVLVVIHGGGFAIGSANAPMYDGAMMALTHDVVVVAVNHRLNVLGYCALDGDDRVAGSHLAGMTDLVLALHWVRDNIAAFGGDPDCVTLIGQSGGGWKISTLLAMPAARGLFHRAVVQSGSWQAFPDADTAHGLTRALLAALGLGAQDWHRLLDVDIGLLLAASVEVGPLAFMPSRDDVRLPWAGDDPLALALGADVPMIISTTREDAGLFYDNFDLTDDGLQALLDARFGDQARAIAVLYRGAAATPYLTWARIVTDAGFRRLAHAQADARATVAAPTWMYRWDWPCPAWDGRYGAAHAMDVAASLARPDDALLGGASGAAVDIVAAHSAMIAGFAATGVPGGPHGAHWQPHDSTMRACLLINEDPRLVHDPDGEHRTIWDGYPLPTTVA